MKAKILQRIVVGLSGGVDSAVSAWLLQQQGHEVIGMFMKNWEDDDDDQYCSSRQDWIDAVAVADVLGIDIEHINFSHEYKERVFSEFLKEYQAGRTPNPDILCNAEIKFKAFLDHAMQCGADKIATGHYAGVQETPHGFQLLKGQDPHKDQSYFLYRLNQAQLSQALFPLHTLNKKQVRQIAQEVGLPNAQKKDSTGICFIGERPFRAFLSRYLHNAPGPIKNDKGDIIGQHQGLSFYTIGQRQGLGIGGIKNHSANPSIHQPWFVARKDIQNQTLWVVQGHDHPWLQTQHLQASSLHWINPQAPLALGRYHAKTRYRQSDAPCKILSLTPTHMALDFEQAQWAITPGQSVVLYQDNVCLGGGIIDTACEPIK